MDITIRTARPGDYIEIRPLQDEIAALHYAGRPDLLRPGAETRYLSNEVFTERLNNPDHFIFIAEDEAGEIVGYAFSMLLRFRGHSTNQDFDGFYIDDICVLQRYRGRGIGRLLFDCCKKSAESAGCRNLELDVWSFNESALRFYRKLGMHERKVRMELPLAAPALRLETDRLILRPMTKGDFEAVHAYASVLENVKYMIFGPNDEEATREFLRKSEKEWQARPVRSHEFAVTRKPAGAVIGGCGIYLNQERTEAMLGWILHRDYWKQGYMAEAGEALLGYCFETLQLHRVYATCNGENYGSYRVMEKLGMRREARFVKNRFGRVGEEKIWYDELHYAILDEEWKEQKAHE